MLVFIGNIVHAPHRLHLEILIDHVLKVDNGIIISCEPNQNYTPNSQDEVVYLSKYQFLFPGFIDTHTHAPQYPNAGILGKTTLLDWLNKYTFPLEGKFENVEIAEQVYNKVVDRQLANGTTCASYFGTVHIDSTLKLASICNHKGQRAFVGRVCMSQHCPDYLQDKNSLHSDQEFHQQCKYKLVKPVITPRFAPSCPFESLLELGNYSKLENLNVQTHISENCDEITWVNELFNKSYLDVYLASNLLGSKTCLAHAIHLQDEEITTLIKTNSGISHCPMSNASLASGIAPIKKYLDLGMKVSLGTDMSAGATFSILRAVRLSIMMSRLLGKQSSLSVDEALYIATTGGAQVLDLPNLGSFQKGYKFDAQLIDITNNDSPIDLFDFQLPICKHELVEYLVHKWVYIGDDRNTTRVWVNGQLVYSKY